MDTIEICCLCGNGYIGFGNNAYPIKEDKCCDNCNKDYVIPERIKRINERESKCKK